jgi:hypothetical protein
MRILFGVFLIELALIAILQQRSVPAQDTARLVYRDTKLPAAADATVNPHKDQRRVVDSR